MKKKIMSSFSPFHIFSLVAVFLAITFSFINYKIAFIPLSLFILACIIAPFITWAGFFLHVISRGHSGKKAVALTFDDGPDKSSTPSVLKILLKYSAKAIFFVTGENAVKNPDIIIEILEQGHSIGNHSNSHDPLLMLRSKRRLYNEIRSAQDVLKKFGILPRVFRPPAGITNPRLGRVLQELDLLCVNWSIRAFDAGNRRINGLAEKILRKVKQDDIILLHDITTRRNEITNFLIELELLLTGLKNSGLEIVPLSELIGKEVMRTGSSAKEYLEWS